MSLSKFVNLYVLYMIKSNCFLSVFQSVSLICFTLDRTNHLLWTDPEVEPDGGPEVEPDGGPDVAASPSGHLDLGVTVTTPNRLTVTV